MSDHLEPDDLAVFRDDGDRERLRGQEPDWFRELAERRRRGRDDPGEVMPDE